MQSRGFPVSGYEPSVGNIQGVGRHLLRPRGMSRSFAAAAAIPAHVAGIHDTSGFNI
jgi:hypothetical protein